MPASPAGWHSIAEGFLCEQSWVFRELRKVRKLVKKGGSHFAVGTLFHAGRAAWFKGGFKPFSEVIVFKMAEDEEKETYSAQEKEGAHALLQDYMEHWAKFSKPRVLAVEHTFRADLFKATGKLGLFGRRTARLDDLSVYPEAGNRLAIGEAKTTSEPISKVITEYGPTHGQILMQAAVVKGDPAARKYGPLSGVVLDVVRKKYNKSGGGIVGAECARHFTPHYTHALSWFSENLRLLASRLSVIDAKGVGLRNHTACQRPRRGEFGTNFYECEYATLCAHGKTGASEYIYGEKASSLTTAPPWMIS
jgi:hypothetical protein